MTDGVVEELDEAAVVCSSAAFGNCFFSAFSSNVRDTAEVASTSDLIFRADDPAFTEPDWRGSAEAAGDGETEAYVCGSGCSSLFESSERGCGQNSELILHSKNVEKDKLNLSGIRI